MIGKKRSRIKLGRKEYDALLAQVFHRDKWRCRVCRSRNNLTAHHIRFRSHGGDDLSSNLVTLCSYCHDSIHKPNPRTGAMLVIMPVVDGEEINADGQVRFYFANNWKPKRVV